MLWQIRFCVIPVLRDMVVVRILLEQFESSYRHVAIVRRVRVFEFVSQ